MSNSKEVGGNVQTADDGSRKRIDPKTFREILTAHEAWLRSKGRCFSRKKGMRANLSNRLLSREDLAGVDLREANLSGVDFGGADVFGTNLRHTDLTNARLGVTTGLTRSALGGADLTNARLPEGLEYDNALPHIDEAIKNAGKLSITVLFLCAYSILTAATTTDLGLLLNSSSTPLPVIGAKIPIVGFYWVMPVVILCLFVYLHVHLQRLWEAIAELPAFMPDGVQVTRRIYPWVPAGLVMAYYPRLREKRQPMLWLQVAMSWLMLWAIVPITLHCFWGRCLCRHDRPLITLHVLLVTFSVVVALWLWHIATATLRNGANQPLLGKRVWADPRNLRYAGVLALVLGAYVWLSAWPMGWVQASPPQGWYCSVVYQPNANIAGAELSVGSVGSSRHGATGIKGADLSGSDIRGVIASDASLAGCSLQFASLNSADFTRADLRGAHLAAAGLTNTCFFGACADGADFMKCTGRRAAFGLARLVGSDMRFANMSRALFCGACLRGADLEGTDLRGANLQGADLHKARLLSADLRGATLGGGNAVCDAHNLKPEQLTAARLDAYTRLPSYLQMTFVHGKTVVTWAGRRQP